MQTPEEQENVNWHLFHCQPSTKACRSPFSSSFTGLGVSLPREGGTRNHGEPVCTHTTAPLNLRLPGGPQISPRQRGGLHEGRRVRVPTHGDSESNLNRDFLRLPAAATLPSVAGAARKTKSEAQCHFSPSFRALVCKPSPSSGTHCPTVLPQLRRAGVRKQGRPSRPQTPKPAGLIIILCKVGGEKNHTLL